MSLLQALSRDPQYENPKLLQLKAILVEKVAEKESRTIMFCKTRKLALALVKWMKDDDQLRHLSPHHLTGNNAKASRGGNNRSTLGCRSSSLHLVMYFIQSDISLATAARLP